MGGPPPRDRPKLGAGRGCEVCLRPGGELSFQSLSLHLLAPLLYENGTKKLSRSLTPDQGNCPWTPLGAPPLDRYRLVLRAACARHGPPFLANPGSGAGFNYIYLGNFEQESLANANVKRATAVHI